LDARYEQLRHAALHARAEAFPLGFAVLTRRGVTGWRHALATLSPTTRPLTPAAAPAATPAALPGPIAAELVNALAAVALAGS
jgi:hypothetical protein